MTFREDFGVFWAGVLGVVFICFLCNRDWDRFTTLATIAAVVYVGLYGAAYGLP